MMDCALQMMDVCIQNAGLCIRTRRVIPGKQFEESWRDVLAEKVREKAAYLYELEAAQVRTKETYQSPACIYT